MPAENFEKNQITWNIDVESKSIHLTNNVDFEENSLYPFKEDGSYNLDLGNEQLTIEYQDRSYSFAYDISGNTLTLRDRPESDGPVLRLKKL